MSASVEKIKEDIASVVWAAEIAIKVRQPNWQAIIDALKNIIDDKDIDAPRNTNEN